MFDAVRNSKRISQIILIIITVPFAFWGVDSYFHGGGPGDLAVVGDSKISRQEFSQAVRDQQERLRSQLGAQFNAAMLETSEARQAILESLITRRLLLLHASKNGLMASDALLRDTINAIPVLQKDGKFSRQRYEQALASQGLTQAGFEAKLRQDLTVQQLIQAVSESAIVSQASTQTLASIQFEERSISETIIRPEHYSAQVSVADSAIKDDYDKNRQRFEIPLQIRAEYVVLSREALAEQTPVTQEEARSVYDKNANSYVLPEERRASHILIQSPKDAPEAAQKAAKAKIEAILQQVRKNPGDFAKLAKDRSEDPGSAAKGGDLGFFPREAMVKPFEDAAFSLKQDQISDIVQSDFGYHIIHLTGIKPGKTRSFEDVRDSIVSELKLAAATRKFAEAAETFSNMVYEQSDSLKPAAEKFKLQIQQTGLFDKRHPAAAGPLGTNEKMLSALFSEDALKNHRNTDAIEIAPNTLMAARVIEEKPAELRPFEAVKSEIEKKLKAEEASRLAVKEGEARLAKLVKGEKVDVSWAADRKITRQPMPGLDPLAQRAIFKASVAKLPAYAGVGLADGSYALFRIAAVQSGAGKGANEQGVKALEGQLKQLTGAEDFNDFLMALRERYGVKIDKAALAKKDND